MILPKGGEAGKSFTMLNLTRNRPPKYGVSSGPSMIASTDVISLSSRIIWTPSNGSCFKFCTSLARILISWGFRFSTLDTMIGKIWRVWRLIFQNLQISFFFQKIVTSPFSSKFFSLFDGGSKDKSIVIDLKTWNVFCFIVTLKTVQIKRKRKNEKLEWL